MSPELEAGVLAELLTLVADWITADHEADATYEARQREGNATPVGRQHSKALRARFACEEKLMALDPAHVLALRAEAQARNLIPELEATIQAQAARLAAQAEALAGQAEQIRELEADLAMMERLLDAPTDSPIHIPVPGFELEKVYAARKVCMAQRAALAQATAPGEGEGGE